MCLLCVTVCLPCYMYVEDDFCKVDFLLSLYGGSGDQSDIFRFPWKVPLPTELSLHPIPASLFFKKNIIPLLLFLLL